MPDTRTTQVKFDLNVIANELAVNGDGLFGCGPAGAAYPPQEHRCCERGGRKLERQRQRCTVGHSSHYNRSKHRAAEVDRGNGNPLGERN